MSLRGCLLNWTGWNGYNDRLQNILEDNANKNTTQTKMTIMTDYNDDDDDDDSHHYHHQQQIIRYPNCKASITVEELHEYVNAKPESKRERGHKT